MNPCSLLIPFYPSFVIVASPLIHEESTKKKLLIDFDLSRH